MVLFVVMHRVIAVAILPDLLPLQLVCVVFRGPDAFAVAGYADGFMEVLLGYGWVGGSWGSTGVG